MLSLCAKESLQDLCDPQGSPEFWVLEGEEETIMKWGIRKKICLYISTETKGATVEPMKSSLFWIRQILDIINLIVWKIYLVFSRDHKHMIVLLRGECI